MTTPVVDLLRRIEREFGAPFLPSGFVSLRKLEIPDGGYLLTIGDRELEVDEDGQFIGTSSRLGEQSQWVVEPR